jgi:LAO/AO transport system kinase
MLSQAITLVESSLPEHLKQPRLSLKNAFLSVQVGKDWNNRCPRSREEYFIETFGLHITGEGRKLAVLTIDPSSEQTKGSILGDKTRMEQLKRSIRMLL